LSSLWNYHREGLSREGVLKRYAVLYDNIIFNRRGIGIGKGELAESLGEAVSMLIHPGKTLSERRSYGKNKEFCDIFVDCWEFTSNAEKFEKAIFEVIETTAHSRVSDFCHKELSQIHGGYSYDIDQAKELYSDLIVDLGINQLLHNEDTEIVSSYAPIVGRAISNEYAHQGVECHDLFSNDLLIPNFDELSWEQIIEFRSDKYIKAFRQMVFDIATNNPVNLDQAIVSKVQKDLWALTSEVKPNVTKTFLSGFLGLFKFYFV